MAYGLDESGLISRFADQFRAVDEEYGRGYVASNMVADQFGTPGYGWQRTVATTAIDDSKAYLQDMAVKSRNLLRSKIGGMSGNAKSTLSSSSYQIKQRVEGQTIVYVF